MSVQFKFDQDKAVAAISYLASKNIPELSKGKLCKLLFLADKYHLVRYARPVTGDIYWAVPHGPIPSSAKNMLDALEIGASRELGKSIELDKRFLYPRISAKNVAALEHLSESDVEALDHVVSHFGPLTFTQLRALTHEMPAYEKAWGRRGVGDSAPMEFEDFFEEDEDAIVGAKEEMLENFCILRAFASE